MLKGVEQISKETIQVIKDIETLMEKTKNTILENKPKIYSKDLLESLFYHPYTKITFIEEVLGVTRKTASNYLKELELIGILTAHKKGREVYYVHDELFDLFRNG